MRPDLRLGKWQDVLADVACDALISDPPYGERTHAGQRGDRKGRFERPDLGWVSERGIGYAHWTHDDVREFVASWAPRTRGWMAVFASHDLLPIYYAAMEAAGRYVFAPIACVQPGMNVRLAGDGPSNWTTYLIVSRPRSLRAWGTLPGAYVVGHGGTERADNPVAGGKPLDLMRRIVADYSRPGDIVCDPCAGGGTTLLAAAIEGRRSVGAEMDPATYAKAAARLARPLPQLLPGLCEPAGVQEPLL